MSSGQLKEVFGNRLLFMHVFVFADGRNHIYPALSLVQWHAEAEYTWFRNQKDHYYSQLGAKTNLKTTKKVYIIIWFGNVRDNREGVFDANPTGLQLSLLCPRISLTWRGRATLNLIASLSMNDFLNRSSVFLLHMLCIPFIITHARTKSII